MFSLTSRMEEKMMSTPKNEFTDLVLKLQEDNNTYYQLIVYNKVINLCI